MEERHAGTNEVRHFCLLGQGKTFDEISGVEPPTFGFAVVVHPREPDTAWFVPEIKDEKRIPRDGRVVVTRTHDGAKSFDILANGLRQEHAYDVVYRHAMAIGRACASIDGRSQLT
jgi:hypothetical protein